MSEVLTLVAKTTGNSIDVCGCVTWDAAHLNGLPHAAVQILPVTWDPLRLQPTIFLHRRSPYKWVSPDTWDFCGGHVLFDGAYFLGEAWQSPYRFEDASADAALKEAREEILVEPQFEFQPEHLRRLECVGYFECHKRTGAVVNVEFSSVFTAAVPMGATVRIVDDDPNGTRELETRSLTWGELADWFQREAASFADGVERVFDKIDCDPDLNASVEQLLNVTGLMARRLSGMKA